MASKPVAGEDASVRFKITGADGSVPLSNLRPMAWIDQRQSPQAPATRECREKVQAFLQDGSVDKVAISEAGVITQLTSWVPGLNYRLGFSE